MSMWSTTAISPGSEAFGDVPGPPVDPSHRRDAGRALGWDLRSVESFIAASSSPTPGRSGSGGSRLATGRESPACSRGSRAVGRERRVGLGQLEQLAGVCQRGVGVLEAGEHPRQLSEPAALVEGRDAAVVTEPSPLRTTTWCRSANAATCGRWVTTMTWDEVASRASRRPISTAALPPTPASTSSKTIVAGGALPARHTSRASMMRESSPPEAPLRDRHRGAPHGWPA